MEYNTTSTPTQWRWDWSDPKKVTSIEWAGRNCVSVSANNHELHRAMQKQVLQDVKRAAHIIAGELHQLLHDAAEITGITYCCKLTQQTLPCINNKDIRMAWLQDGQEANMQRLAWIFYYYGTKIHRLGQTLLTHGEWVERKVMNVLNVTYVHWGELPMGQQTCIQQLYSKKFNDLRTNIMRGGTTIQHTSMVKKEQPKVPGMFKKNFKRGKTMTFATMNVSDNGARHKVSRRCV
jgi:hypothetical protein